jgi:hypothetical protein
LAVIGGSVLGTVHVPRIGALPITRQRALFVIAAVVAAVSLVRLGLGMTFFADEWAFIQDRSLSDPTSWLRPHNEHWSTLPVLLYRAIVETIGIGSYVPFQLAVVALHLVVATCVYLLLERSSGPVFALAGSLIVLFFGSGFENLYWGFQIGFVGSTALGLIALLVTDAGPSRSRAAAVALLLIASMATSGIGLVMSVVVGVEWLLDARWRRWVPTLVIPAAVYLGWYLAFGQAGIDTHRVPFSLTALADVPPFIARGLGNAVTSVTGLSPILAALAAIPAVAFGYRRWRQGRLAPRVISTLAGCVALYAMSGLVRAQLFDGQADYTRYTYESGILMIVAIGALVGRLRIEQPRLRSLAVVAGATALGLSLVLNGALLLGGRELFLQRADMTRALVTVALEAETIPGAQAERSLILVPSADEVRRIAAAYGDPRGDRLAAWAVRSAPAPIMAEARRRLVQGAVLPLVCTSNDPACTP